MLGQRAGFIDQESTGRPRGPKARRELRWFKLYPPALHLSLPTRMATTPRPVNRPTLYLLLPESCARPSGTGWSGRELGVDLHLVHVDAKTEKPAPWPNGIIPFDLSRPVAPTGHQCPVGHAPMDGHRCEPHLHFGVSTQKEYVYFTGSLDAGNNTTFNGFRKGSRLEVNITAFWWRQGPWMPVHELGHALGLFHEHQRWDRTDT